MVSWANLSTRAHRGSFTSVLLQKVLKTAKNSRFLDPITDKSSPGEPQDVQFYTNFAVLPNPHQTDPYTEKLSHFITKTVPKTANPCLKYGQIPTLSKSNPCFRYGQFWHYLTLFGQYLASVGQNPR